MKRYFLGILVFFIIAGCGQSGKLYLPEEPAMDDLQHNELTYDAEN